MVLKIQTYHIPEEFPDAVQIVVNMWSVTAKHVQAVTSNNNKSVSITVSKSVGELQRKMQ